MKQDDGAERWLAQQHMETTFKGIKGSSVSLVPIAELSLTRRMLLSNLESACCGNPAAGVSQATSHWQERDVSGKDKANHPHLIL